MSQKFFTTRFFLDTPVDRFTNRGASHFIGPFRSFWVSNTNNSNFQCDLVINPRDDRGRGLPLRLNQCQAIGSTNDDKALEGCIEFKIAQPGTWIEITFAQDDVIQVGSVAVSLTSGLFTEYEGARLAHTKKTVTAAIAELIPANDNRLIARIQFKSGVDSVYVGTPAELADPDFLNICTEIKPGESYTHKLTCGLSARSTAGNVVYSLFEGLKA